MKRKTLYLFLSILLFIHANTEPVKTGLSVPDNTGFEHVNDQGESVEDIQVPKGHTAQPDFKFATESPKLDAPPHTSGPITFRATTIQYFDELTSSYISLGSTEITDESISDEISASNEENNNTKVSSDNVKEMCMTMPYQSQLWSTSCEGILFVVVGICGLMGNGATIAVLSRPTFRETFHKLLICLSCFDSLFIGCALMIYAIRAHSLHLTGQSLVHYVFMIIYPLGNVALYGSIYLTLAVSIERFLGLVYPVQTRTRPRRHLLAYLLPVILFSVGFNVPKFMEFQMIDVERNNKTHVEAGESDLARNKTYTHYYKIWSNLILTAVIPLIVLVFCNSAIFIVLRQSRKAMNQSRQKSNNTSGNTGGSSNKQSGSSGLSVPANSNGINGTNAVCCAANSNASSTSCHSSEHSLAIILAAIVFVFMICHACRFFLAFYQVSIAERTSACVEKKMMAPQPEWLYILSAINHLMLMVNSSVNFIIYCAVGSRFRRALTCPLIGGTAGNRRARYLAATQWAVAQNNSNQAHNINSCNNGSDWSDRKSVRVIWRRGRGMCGSRSGLEAAAVVDESQGNSLILLGQVSEHPIGSMRQPHAMNHWDENAEDISVELMERHHDGIPSPIAHAVEVTKTAFLNGAVRSKAARSPSDVSWSDDVSQESSPANWFRVKAEVNQDRALCLPNPRKKQTSSPCRARASEKAVASFSKSTSFTSSIDINPLPMKHLGRTENGQQVGQTCSITSTDI